MLSWDDFLLHSKDRGLIPKNIEVAQWRNWYIASGFEKASSKYISENVSMGISKDPDLALRKSIVEFMERQVFSGSQAPQVIKHRRSDGTAAFPLLDQDSIKIAQHNAKCEAAERFLWANWWDNFDFKHNMLSHDLTSAYLGNDLDFLLDDFNLKNVQLIQINDLKQDYLLIIFIALNKNGGYLTGGACEFTKFSVDGINILFERAFGELLRHLLAYKRMTDYLQFEKLTFYEKRLFGFASGKWSDLVLARLSNIGIIDVPLTQIEVSSELTHVNNDLLYVHHTLFHNQPTFIGGSIDRLCI